MSSDHINCEDFGPLLGELKSTSEKVQVIICLAGLIPFGLLWMLGYASTLVLFVGMFGTIGIGHLISMRLPQLRSTAQIYEAGMTLNIRGKESSFAYESLGCISSKHVEHVTKYGYVGTRFEWLLELDGSFHVICYEGEFHRAKVTAQTVALAEKKCSEGVERRLLASLKQNGEIEWRTDVFLTPTGLRIVDGRDVEPRVIRFAEIGDWNIKDNQLRIFRTGEALPCFSLPNNSRNFIPIFGLFEKIARRCKANTKELQSSLQESIS